MATRSSHGASLKAIIYAAGSGSRLGTAGGVHKSLLSFGGRSLLEWHVLHLGRIAVRELVVVTGHGAKSVEAELERLKPLTSIELRTLHNPDYRLGSVLSMAASIPEIEGLDGTVLLMDADVLYATELLRCLIRSPRRTALLVDRAYSLQDDDPVLVPVVGGEPIDFRKRWSGRAEWVGESVGFFKIDAGDVPLLVERTRARLVGAGRSESYDEVLRDLVVAGCFGCEDISGLPWTEIDFPSDLSRARREVLPAILAREP